MVQNEYIVDVEKGRVHYQNRTYGLREFFEMVDDKREFIINRRGDSNFCKLERNRLTSFLLTNVLD